MTDAQFCNTMRRTVVRDTEVVWQWIDDWTCGRHFTVTATSAMGNTVVNQTTGDAD